MLAIIFNHNVNAGAIALRDGLAPLMDVRLLDSGSALSPQERSQFDECHPNIFYAGLINRAAELAAARQPGEPVIVICSDVQVADYAAFRDRVALAFAAPQTLVWAPASPQTVFDHMEPQHSGGLRRVTFTDGFCFAARQQMFGRFLPMDVTINWIGWGPDVQFGYHAAVQGGICVVDDALIVQHGGRSGYNRAEAMRQYLAWRRTLPWPARLFDAASRLKGWREGRRGRLLIGLTVLMARLARQD